MKINRRNFLKATAAAPAVAPQLVKKVADEAAATRLLSGGISHSEDLSDFVRVLSDHKVKAAAFRLNLFADQDKVNDLITRHYKRVYTLDVDLATNKSMSLSAKVYHQRQRNIQRAKDQLAADYDPENLWSYIKRLKKEVNFDDE